MKKNKIALLLIMAVFCMAPGSVLGKGEDHDRVKDAVGRIVKQRNELRKVLGTVEGELNDVVEKELDGDDSDVVGKVQLIIRMLKDSNNLIDSLVLLIPGDIKDELDGSEQSGENGELLKALVQVFVGKYQETTKNRDRYKRQLSSKSKENRRLKEELKKLQGEYDELHKYFMELVTYAEENKR